MADPMSPTSTVEDLEEDGSREDDSNVAAEVISAPAPPAPANGDASIDCTLSANRHYIAPKRVGTFDSLTNRRGRRWENTLRAYPEWERPPELRRPYHEYVHSLVEGGWDMMGDLDVYMRTDLEDAKLTISVLEVAADGSGSTRWPDLHDESDLVLFMHQNRQRPPGSVRLYLTEQKDGLAAGVIEALGTGLDLDPRFFQWSLVGHKHVLSPSHRHHAPYVSIGFGVPKLETANRTDAERFKVTVYIQPDEAGSGWTGTSSVETCNLCTANAPCA